MFVFKLHCAIRRVLNLSRYACMCEVMGMEVQFICCDWKCLVVYRRIKPFFCCFEQIGMKLCQGLTEGIVFATYDVFVVKVRIFRLVLLNNLFIFVVDRVGIVEEFKKAILSTRHGCPTLPCALVLQAELHGSKWTLRQHQVSSHTSTVTSTGQAPPTWLQSCSDGMLHSCLRQVYLLRQVCTAGCSPHSYVPICGKHAHFHASKKVIKECYQVCTTLLFIYLLVNFSFSRK